MAESKSLLEGWPWLEVLDVSYNKLTSLPTELFSHSPRLSHLNLANNNLTGGN